MEFLHFGSLIPQLYEIVAKFLKYKIPLALIHFNYTTVVYAQLLFVLMALRISLCPATYWQG